MGISIRERIYEQRGKKAIKTDPKDWGRLVFRHDTALAWSQGRHLKIGMFPIGVYLSSLSMISIDLWSSRQLTFGLIQVILLFIMALVGIALVYTIWIHRTANQLPALFENGVLYSTVLTIYLERYYLPYTEIKSIERKNDWVRLHFKETRGWFAFRIEELGEKGYELLMDLFTGTESKGEPPKLIVYP